MHLDFCHTGPAGDYRQAHVLVTLKNTTYTSKILRAHTTCYIKYLLCRLLVLRFPLLEGLSQDEQPVEDGDGHVDDQHEHSQGIEHGATASHSLRQPVW